MAQSFPTRRASDRPCQQEGQDQRLPPEQAFDDMDVRRVDLFDEHEHQRQADHRQQPQRDPAQIMLWRPVKREGGGRCVAHAKLRIRSEEHTSELQSLMRISYAVFCLKKTKNHSIKLRTK